MRTPSRLALAALAFALVACGGDDGDGTPGDGDGGSIDAPPGTIDAAVDAPPGASALGRACTGMGQGDCPAGYECLTLPGGNGSWCSKRCADFQDPSCADGYTGPGFPMCVLGVRPTPNDPPVPYCEIVCQDLPGAPDICLPGECTGACPAPLMCTANLTTMPGQVVARACQ